MIAIIETGGKQYLVSPDVTVTIPKLAVEAGKSVTFDKVLLLADEEKGTVQVGTPYIDGATISATVSAHPRKKTIVIKYKPKVRYRRKAGHTDIMTKVKVGEVK